MSCRMLINATVADELRVAVVQDGELIDLDIEAAEQGSIRGNIYKGVVHNVEGSLAAAFVDFGQHKQGFLPFSEIAPHQYNREWKSKDSPRITDVIKRGQDIVVQVSKDAVGDKGAALTTHLSLAGRFSVLMPGSESKGVSRKIEDEADRKKIRTMASKIEIPNGCGFIVRTAGLGQTKTAIQKDLDRLAEIWLGIDKASKIARAPSLLHAEPDVIGRTLRDLYNLDIDEVQIDSFEEYAAAKEYFEELMPEEAERIQHYANPIPIFSYFHVEEQIEATFHRRVPLPSGGSIVIDRTEALVAVDVNSGKNTSERDHEDTVYKTNYEAAEVVARQLRLRDLGGIVVVDFIDMELSRNQRAVVTALRNAAKDDKARVKISKILSNGLCILTRQRIRAGIQKSFQRRCGQCDGTGWIRTPESHSLSLLKRIETRLAQGGVGECRVKTHKDSAEHINNFKRGELHSLEQQYNCKIIIVGRTDMDRDKDDVSYVSMGQVLAEITDRLPSREEMRKSRGGRKRSRKKKSDRSRPAPSRESRDPDADEGEGRRRRRKRKDEAVGAETKGRGPAEPEPAGPGGTTFTGKPPPEMLAKIKAQREARKAARDKKRAASSAGLVEDTGASSQPPTDADAVVEVPELAAEVDTQSVEPLDVIDAVDVSGDRSEDRDEEAVAEAAAVAAALAEEPAEVRTDEVVAEVPEVSEEPAPPPKRKRARRKKKVTPKKDVAVEAEAAPSDEAVPAEDAPKPKRARKRAPRKKAVAAEAPVVGVAAGEAAPTEGPAPGSYEDEVLGLPADAKRPGFFSRLLRGGRREDAPVPPDEETG